MSDDFDLAGWAPDADGVLDWKPEPVRAPEIKPRPFREDEKAEELRKRCIPATSRRMECPGCGLPWHVQPTYSGAEWYYNGTCGHCGATWTNAYHLMIKCEDCGKKNPVTSRNPEGKCNCGEEVARPF